MAWAVDRDTDQPRYILQLDADHRGAKSNCKCPCCGLPLLAVNAAKTTFKKRPHFRHPEGAARELCLVIAARRALNAMFGKQERITLPRRRRSRNIAGLSGRYFDAWVELPSEEASIKQCDFHDATTAILTLVDGRRLAIQLVGHGEVTRLDGDEALLARIEIDVDDPSIAMMSPVEIFAHLELAWTKGCWVRHWSDSEMDREAEAMARKAAADALDWPDDDALPSGLSSTERRETLLHREVKAILERERRIRLPELSVEAQWQRSNGAVDTRTWSEPDREVALSSVDLEVDLGRAVPDVIAAWVDEDGWTHSFLIEVTVTNPITPERIERLSSFGWPALEIDIGRMGGVVSREEFTRLVVEEAAGKRWLYHPTLVEEEAHLLHEMKREEVKGDEAERRRRALLDRPAADWASSFLDAFQRRWREQQVSDGILPTSVVWKTALEDIACAIEGLVAHGYPASGMDGHPLRTIISRILSIKLDTGIEYKFDNAWGVINAIRCDRDVALQWHTLYLIAVRTYRPALRSNQQERTDAWRDAVVASIKAGDSEYVRDTVYDRLLGLLFPEIQAALTHPFGTPLYIADEDYEAPEALSVTTEPPLRGGIEGDLILRGREFEEWARQHPEAAKAWLESPAGKKFQEADQTKGQQPFAPWKRKRI